MKKIATLYLLPVTVISIIKNLKRQKKFLKKKINPILDNAKVNNDGTLSEKDFDKINKYYGLAVPAILAEAFCTLQNRKLSEKERMISTCQGATTGLFDDFFDEKYLNEIDILEKIESSNKSLSKNSNEGLFDFFYLKMLEMSKSPEIIKEYSRAIYKEQVKSKLQQTDNLSAQQTWEITLSKGGNSLLFYRAAVEPPASDKEKAVLFLLGGLMQLSNDIFDIYKDREAGIKTLPMFYEDIEELKLFFQEKLQAVYAEAYSLPFDRYSIQRFLSILSISVFSRSFVCLQQLEELQKTTGNIFQLSTYSRNQLICDMDTKKNMLHSAAYHVKYLP
ncbi:MAG: hypothetical protein ABIW38_04610 [Ferruginibacter sp.]